LFVGSKRLHQIDVNLVSYAQLLVNLSGGKIPPGMYSSLDTLMACVGHYEIKPLYMKTYKGKYTY